MSGAWRLLLLAALLRAPQAAWAQEAPRDVAASFFAAVAEARWRDAARLLDLRAFDRYRRELIASMRLPVPERTITVEEILRHQPDMPRAVAEYQVSKAQEAQRDVSAMMLSHDYAGVTSVDSLAAMSAEEAAARWVQARDDRWMSRRALEAAVRRGHCPPGLTTDRPEAVAPQEIVGTVITDSVAYVLHVDPRFRSTRPDADLHGPGPSVLQLRPVAGRWRIVPRQDVLRARGAVFVSADCMPVDSTTGRRRRGGRD